ncbi:AAA family ATPase [Microbacterium sp. ET2]|uniref:AAA family ATPase n=1 Tax=Microbacterium albipurpureum TaxID=3050384 RepID=UPI00259CDFF9|nr:AAA family ATPase [Microbacterium sp. ET2 (Ac-2212)]WJL95878.1 AAA family ATPase [Microbacterium sp. ET2 (Ac-2212)]
MSTTTTIDATTRVVDALAARVKIKPFGQDRWRAQCPAHNGHDLNLSVAKGDQGVLLKCWSHNCSETAIAQALGMQLRDLFDRDGRAIYDYGGDYKIQRTRLASEFGSAKEVRPVRAGITPDLRPLWQPEGSATIAQSSTVMLCEGEKTADALVRLGVPCVATWAGGTGGVEKADYSPLAGRKVVVVPDNDEPGAKAAAALLRLLTPIAEDVRVWRVPGHLNDAADLWLEGGTIEDLTVDNTPPGADAPPVSEDTPDADDDSDHSAHATTWEEVSIADIVAGIVNGTIEPVRPQRLTRDDGAALFYDGKVNGIHGESGSGKSWTALYACAQEIANNHHVIYVDFEDSPRDVVGRLINLGADPADITARFHYVQPEAPFVVGADTLLELIHQHDVTLVIIDSTGEAMSMDGAQQNADEDVTRWFQQVTRRIARQGPAVVVLDHLPKAGGSDLMPIGSQRKRSAINGAQYLQETLTSFSKQKAGAARLKVAKDRNGDNSTGDTVATLHVTPIGGGNVRIAFTAPDPGERTEAGEFRPTTLMSRVSRVVQNAPEPMSYRRILDNVTGKKDHVRQAVNVLIQEGYIATAAGPRGAILHIHVKPFEGGGTLNPQISEFSTVDRSLFLGKGTGEQSPPFPGEQWGTVGEQSSEGQTQPSISLADEDAS